MQIPQKLIKQESNTYKLNCLVGVADHFQKMSILDMLELCQIQATCCDSGSKGKLLLWQNSPQIDIILWDINMPELTATELLEWISQQEETKEIPIVVLSGQPYEEDHPLLKQGAKKILSKPIKLSDIQQLEGCAKHHNQISVHIQYKPIKLLGEGSLGKIYLCKRSTDQLICAMKVLPMHFFKQQIKTSVEEEICLHMTIDSPYILKMLDYFIDDNTLYMIVEYIEGGSLYSLIQKKRETDSQFDKNQILDWIAQLLVAVQHMHNLDLVHGYINSRHIYLENNIIKLSSYYCRQAISDGARIANLSKMILAAPENIKTNNTSIKADVWSIGIILYELVELYKPFQADNLKDIVGLILESQPKFENQVDQDLALLIHLMLTKNPDQRPDLSQLAQLPFLQDRVQQCLDTK